MAGPTPALIALFNNYIAGLGGFHSARLYTITLAGGGVLRFTDADFPILGNSTSPRVNGFTYLSSGVGIDQKESKTQAHLKVGTDTDTWTVVFIPRPVDLVTGAPFPDMVGSVPFLQACQGGAFDAADFQVDEAYFSAIPTWPMPPAGMQPVGCRTVFAGQVAEVDTTNLVAIFTVNDFRALFAISVPLNFYQAQCRHALFDSGCSASGGPQAANFAINGTVSAGSTSTTIVANGLPKPQGSGTYQLGRIVFTSGNNATFQRTIKSWDGAFTLGLLNPLPFAVEEGDGFVIYPGCDKTAATCAAFNNTSNYGGFLFIPNPEVMGN